MKETVLKKLYINQLNALKIIVNDSNQRVIGPDPDAFFVNNLNFLTKSFLVLMCTYLESYLKDLLMLKIEKTNMLLSEVEIPHNLIKWSVNNNYLEDKHHRFQPFTIHTTKKDLDPLISGNPFILKTLFLKFGIELDKDTAFNEQKEKINSIITKRNNVVHHNDNASDLTSEDIINNIELLINYLTNIDSIIATTIKNL